jgi:hypothetical protein
MSTEIDISYFQLTKIQRRSVIHDDDVDEVISNKSIFDIFGLLPNQVYFTKPLVDGPDYIPRGVSYYDGKYVMWFESVLTGKCSFWDSIHINNVGEIEKLLCLVNPPVVAVAADTVAAVGNNNNAELEMFTINEVKYEKEHVSRCIKFFRAAYEFDKSIEFDFTDVFDREDFTRTMEYLLKKLSVQQLEELQIEPMIKIVEYLAEDTAPLKDELVKRWICSGCC